jgi:hypothetical protein
VFGRFLLSKRRSGFDEWSDNSFSGNFSHEMQSLGSLLRRCQVSGNGGELFRSSRGSSLIMLSCWSDASD